MNGFSKTLLRRVSSCPGKTSAGRFYRHAWTQRKKNAVLENHRCDWDILWPSWHRCVCFFGPKWITRPPHSAISVPRTWPGWLQTSVSSPRLLKFHLFRGDDCNTWAFPPYFSLPKNAHLWSRFQSLSDYSAWRVEKAAPVTLMISEVTLWPRRPLGRTASRKLMSIPARPWTINRGVLQGGGEIN